eukprot:1136516-Pelagomonas_calceolata.AAC.4
MRSKHSHAPSLALTLQNLVAVLAARFGGDDPKFAFSDASSLTADSGPTTAGALRALGLLQLSPDLGAKVDAGQWVVRRKQLRAVMQWLLYRLAARGEAEQVKCGHEMHQMLIEVFKQLHQLMPCFATEIDARLLLLLRGKSVNHDESCCSRFCPTKQQQDAPIDP